MDIYRNNSLVTENGSDERESEYSLLNRNISAPLERNHLTANYEKNNPEKDTHDNKESRKRKALPPAVKNGIKVKKGKQVGIYLEKNHEEMNKVKDKLKSDVWNWGPVFKWDSKVMRNMNNSLAAIADLMNDEITDKQRDNRLEFKVKADKIDKAYDQAINAATAYIEAREGAWTSSGKRRLQMVKDLKDKLRNEKKMFFAAAWQMYESRPETASNKTPQWADVLYLARSENFALEKGEGGATASIRKFTDKKDNKLKFYKSEEVVLSKEESSILNISEMEKQKFDNMIPKNGNLDVNTLSEEEREIFGWIQVYADLKDLDKKYFKSDGRLIFAIQNSIIEYSDGLQSGHGDRISKAKNQINNLVQYFSPDMEYDDRLKLQNTVGSMLLRTPEQLYKFETSYGKYSGRVLSAEEESELREKCRKESDTHNAEVNRRHSGLRQIRGRKFASDVARNNQIKVGTRLNLRNVATTRMEKLLFGDKYKDHPLIARSKSVINFDGKDYVRGNVMEAAQGVACANLKKKLEESKINIKDEDITISPFALQQVSDLMVMDYLVGQMDRHGNNFFVTYELDDTGEKPKMVITGVTGIDNDLSFTSCTSKMIRDKGGINRLEDISHIKLISKDLAEAIMSLDIKKLKYELADLDISKDEFSAMESRLDELKDRIRRCGECGVTLCSKEDWSKYSLDSIDKRYRKIKRKKRPNDIVRGVAEFMRCNVLNDWDGDINVEKQEA